MRTLFDRVLYLERDHQHSRFYGSNSHSEEEQFWSSCPIDVKQRPSRSQGSVVKTYGFLRRCASKLAIS